MFQFKLRKSRKSGLPFASFKRKKKMCDSVMSKHYQFSTAFWYIVHNVNTKYVYSGLE